MNRLLQFILFFASTFVFARPCLAQASFLQQIQTYLNSDTVNKMAKVSATDARYPIVQILKAFQEDQHRDDSQTIATLKSLFQKSQFQGSMQFQGSHRLVESYGTWRDLAYLIIARAYYEKNQPSVSLSYLNAIPKTSPFVELARAQKIWALIKLGQLTKAQSELQIAAHSNTASTRRLRKEFILQSAVIATRMHRYATAIREAKSITFSHSTLEDTRLRVLAESLFRIYVAKINLKFNESKRRLNEVINMINQITPNDRDANLAYFMADVEWHLANVYQIKDPVKYAQMADEQLDIANHWLTPWLKKSVQLKRPLLPEEAMFLASIVLWEQKKYETAIPRLMLTIHFYPSTQYRADIYQLIGDYYYNHQKFHQAINAYRLLAQTGDVEKAGYGIYKAAWAFYNLKEKFKALRQLERLVLYYQKNPMVKDVAGLQAESLHDMIFMLTELLPAQASLHELQIFRFNHAKLMSVQTDVASDYRKAGKFNDSILVYKTLLKTYPHDKYYYTWLGTLLETELAAGQSRALAKSLNEFIKPSLPVPSGFLKIAVNIQLTIHQEGNKTGDPNIWAATDALYSSMSQHFPNLQSGNFWYFGAQRKQQMGNTKEALKWYAKAALISNYENANDAALTILRILNTMESHDGVTGPPTPSIQQTIVKWSKWYIDHFGHSHEIASCDHLYLEGLLNLKQYSAAVARIKTVITQNPADQREWQNYLYLNDELYNANRWQQAFDLAETLLKLPSKNAAHDKLLRDFRSESAFQVAFQDNKKSIKMARKWYRTAVRVGVHQSVIIKSWHNLLLTYKAAKKATNFVSDYKKFVQQDFDATKLSYSEKALCAETYEFAAAFFRNRLQMDASFKALSHAAGYLDSDQAKILRWQALTGFGAYYDQKNFASELRKWKSLSPHPTTQQQLLLAKIYFWLGNEQKSWKALSPLLSRSKLHGEKAPADTWLFVRDLYVTAARENNLKSAPVFGWIQSHLDRIKTKPSLEGIWSRLKWQKLNDLVAAVTTTSIQRTPQNLSQKNKTKEAVKPLAELTDRLKKVAEILKSMAQAKTQLTALFIKDSPQITVAGLCKAPAITKRAIVQLSTLKLHPLKIAEWNGFATRLQEKVNQLETVEAREVRTCKNKTKEIAAYEPLDYSVTTCFHKICPSISAVTTRQIQQIDRRLPPDINTQLSSAQSLNVLKRTKAFAKIGAWGTAEYWADQLPNPHQKALVLAYLRIVWRDPWTAYSLLQEAAKDSKLTGEVHELQQELADSNIITAPSSRHRQ